MSIYGLKYQSRCLEAIPAHNSSSGGSADASGSSGDRHAFVLGTCDPRGLNELHFVEFDEQERRIDNVLTVQPSKHKSAASAGWDGREVLDLCPSPSVPGCLFVLSPPRGAEQVPEATLWHFNLQQQQQLPPADHQQQQQQQQQQAAAEDDDEAAFGFKLALSGGNPTLSRLLWDPSCEKRVVGLDADGLSVWHDFEAQTGSPQRLTWSAGGGSEAEDPEADPYRWAAPKGSWDPHHPDLLVTSRHRSLRAWDVRAGRPTLEVANAHPQGITDVDFNPNRLYYVASAGRDRRVNVWDIRKPQEPVAVIAGHSHWVESVRYNRFHDQLLLTGGSDHSVNLWSLVSASSAPVGELESDFGAGAASSEAPQDHLVATYDDYDDSVYSVRWSLADAWVFASLSFDGRLVISQVPEAQQYAILL